MLGQYCSLSPQETQHWARRVTKEFLKKNIQIFFLQGDLGSGKTVFVQGMAQELGIKRPVKSPSFVIIQNYPGRKFNLVHVDCYRMQKIGDFKALGLDEFLDDQKNIMAIEWSQKLPLSWHRSKKACVVSIKRGTGSDSRLIQVRLLG